MLEQALAERLLTVASELVAQSDAPGATVAVWHGGRPLLEAGIGSADLAVTTPLDAHARFPVYSVTKTLIAAAILRLVERGVVVLDEPIRTWLPDLPLSTDPTIRQLLRHTGGMPDYGGLAAYHEAVRAHPGSPWSDDQYFSRTLSERPAWQPGERWAYSNIGYMVLRLLLERLVGGSLDEALSAEVFDPLRLSMTGVVATPDDMGRLTPGFSRLIGRGDDLVNVAPAYHPGWVAHGLVASTAPELVRLFDALFSGRLFGGDLLAAMREPMSVGASHPLFARPAYGLGLMIDAAVPGIFAGHGGGGPGYSIGVLHLATPSARITSAALVNRDDAIDALQIAATLARLASGMAWPLPSPPMIRT